MALIKVSNIPTTAIADSAITSSKIASGTITSGNIADGTITATDLHTTAVTDKLGFTPVTDARTLTINGTAQDLTANRSWTIQTGMTWDTVKTTSFTAVANYGYFVNTTSGAITVTLPASPTAGATISIVDYAGTAATNNITINRNANKIEGGTTNKVIQTNREGLTLVYTDATQGWVAVSDVYSSTPYINEVISVSYLVVAGGGGGGGGGAGGGGGGYLTGTFTAERGIVYTATVGAGGAGTITNSPPYRGDQGNVSSLIGTGVSISSYGGGGGGGYESYYNGGNGGSGGGGFRQITTSGTGGSGTVGQGNAGGSNTGQNYKGAGGGGAGAVGGNTSTGACGNGGIGLQSSITGTATYYAGGGGGGADTGTVGSGGAGGGGNGSIGDVVGNPGSSNQGGGGGGGGNGGSINGGGNGGSGVVILRVSTANYSGTTTGSPTITTDGSYKVIKFTASGSYTA